MMMIMIMIMMMIMMIMIVMMIMMIIIMMMMMFCQAGDPEQRDPVPAPAAGRDHGGAGQLPGQHGCPAAGAQAGRGGESGQALGVSGQHPGSLGGPRNTGQQQSHKKKQYVADVSSPML